MIELDAFDSASTKIQVQRIVSRFLIENLICRKSGFVRKRKTIEREDHLIVRGIVKNCR